MTESKRTLGAARLALAVAAMTALLVLLVAGAALADGKVVTVKEISSRYHFVPNDVTIGVGQSVTWTNDSDAPHTVTSDSGGFLDGSLNPGGADYAPVFTTVGDYAYHCNVHSYMHGVVHVSAALPPTDIAGTALSSGPDSGGLGIVTIAAIAGAVFGAAGLLTFVLRRRAIRA